MELDMHYPTYIRSESWRSNPARLQALSDAQGRCRLCGDETLLEVHHATYERIGNERDSDLVALCRECHRDVTSFLRARRYAVVVPKRADVVRLHDVRVLASDPTAGGY
jgi:5-methylcytosine-specific restriction endonuclease McrA